MNTYYINADDFGLSRSLNEGIIHSFEKRLIHSSSISINGSDSDFAVDYLKSERNSKVGVHITLVDGERPLTNNLRHIVDRKGHLLNRSVIFLKSYFDKNIPMEIYLESKAQIEKVLNQDLHITHLDTHQHIHIYPNFHEIFISLCREFKIPKLRIPISISKFKRNGLGNVVNFFSNSLKRKSTVNDVFTYNSFGFDFSGNMKLENLQKISKSNLDNFEIMVHPGFNSEETQKKYGHWNYNWDLEIKSLKHFLEN